MAIIRVTARRTERQDRNVPTKLKRAAHVALFIVTATVLLAMGSRTGTVDAMARETVTVVTDDARIEISAEIAGTPAQQQMGLMFRRSLEEGSGMLFLYPTAREARMWMRNTYIPLDMLFIRADGRIHRIARNTEPQSEAIITSNGDVLAVLEIGGGEARRLGIGVGDQVIHSAFEAE